MRTSLNTTASVINEIMQGGGKTCSAAARHFPAHKGAAKNLDPSKVWRWMAKGVTMPGGRTLQLEAARIAGRILTSDEAIRRFIEAQAQAAESVAVPRTSNQKQRAAEKAETTLETLGV